MDLKEIRRHIDVIDYEIVKLINRRLEHALRLKRLKSNVVEPDREKEVLDRVRGCSTNVVEPDFAEKLYHVIIEESRQIQEKETLLLGFQGEHGAYSEVAAKAYGEGLVALPCASFHDVFQQTATGQLDLGIVPVENSLEGAVIEVNDLLMQTDLRIVGEIRIPIHHCLLALPEQDYRDLRTVYSHPQALGQCRSFITRHRLEPRPFYDTAGAAIMLREQRPPATAVIASRLCADLYQLEILQENIEDDDSNTTRFVLLSKDMRAENGNKCSIIFTAAHRPGGLFSVLKVLADENINMTRIESRPMRHDPGIYAFFVDFQGSDKDERVKGVLEAIQKQTTAFKFLGCYEGKDL